MGSSGGREGAAGVAPSHDGVQEVDAGGLDRDADLALAGPGVGQLLEDEGLGRPGDVLTDGLHARHAKTSSLLEVKRSPRAGARNRAGAVAAPL